MIIFLCLLGWAAFLLLLLLCVFALRIQAHTESAFETYLMTLLLDPPTHCAESAALRREIAAGGGACDVAVAALCHFLMRRAQLDPAAARRRAESLILAAYDGRRDSPAGLVRADGPCADTP